MSIKENSIITKKDLRKNWLTWLSICCLSNNWERMQNIDYAVSMAPILKKLYPDDNEKFSERLSSHMEFFNTQPTAGCLINGMVIAMEEEKAMGKDIPDEAITNLKSSMMGPLAGIGDSVMNSLIEVVLMSIAMTFAFQGNLFGPVFYLVTWVAASLIISWFLINRGYKLGINSLSVMSGYGTPGGSFDSDRSDGHRRPVRNLCCRQHSAGHCGLRRCGRHRSAGDSG